MIRISSIVPTISSPSSVKSFKDVTSKLEKLKSKQKKWSKEVTTEEKLAMIEGAIETFVNEFGLEGLGKLGADTAAMKGVCGKEADYVQAEEMFLMSFAAKGYLETLREAYLFRLGKSENQDLLTNLPTHKIGDQVVADVYPLTPADKAGPFQTHKGEVWFVKEHVQDETNVKSFDFDSFDESNDEGVMVVLGAGNYTMLSIVDCLYALFVQNRVVFLKHHPLRSLLEPLMRKVFAPLYESGFLDSEIDSSLERTQQLIYSPLVTKVHMTGGKATHDAIVWGASKEEQERRKANDNPKLKNAVMTSELGCVSPYLMTPLDFTAEELEHQAKVLISAKWINGSASCNAPQVVLVSENWSQRKTFVSKITESWESAEAACTYYPGAKQRWSNFQKEYPEAKIITSKQASSNDDLHQPLLLVEIEIDLSTEDGRAKVASEYALQTEAFCPVLIVATVKNEGPEDFMSKAVETANKYSYGSLSCTVAVPPSAEGSAMVEKAIGELKYGTVAINAAASYLNWALAWGAVPGETLDAVETGIGKVVNGYLLPHIEKCVIRTPIICDSHFDFVAPYDEIIAADVGITKFVMSN